MPSLIIPTERPWTQGEWGAVPDPDGGCVLIYASTDPDGWIAATGGLEDADRDLANARLIAAAPELFEALLEYYWLSASVEVHAEQDAREMDAVRQRAAAALAKALGVEVTDAERTEALAQEMVAEPTEAAVRASIEASRQPGDCPECGGRRFVLDPERGGGACPACEEAPYA